MAKLPHLTGREIISALERAGFERRSQTGSHVHLVGVVDNAKRLVTVPDHGSKEIPLGTLLSIIRQSGLGRDAFLELV